MSLRLLLPLLLAAAAAGYAGALFVTPRWVDREGPVVPTPQRTVEARAELEALRALVDPAARAHQRMLFLERYPDSWLRAHWAAEIGR